MNKRTIAIMQPTYLPWLGYFDLMDRVDSFVLLDSVQFSKRSWQQRNRIKGPDGALWLSVPVLSKGLRAQLIADVEIDPSASFADKHLRTIAHLYADAPFFQRYMDPLSAILRGKRRLLADMNIELMEWMCRCMEISTETVRSSSLEAAGKRVDLLIAICRELGADRYISPEGSRGYIQENDLFGSNGIELIYHEYRHPEYRQAHGPFVPYLSALDLLLNEGPNSLSVIRAGRSKAEEGLGGAGLAVPDDTAGHTAGADGGMGGVGRGKDPPEVSLVA